MNPSNPIRLSVVIPAYNECNRLPQTLREIRPWLDSQGYAYEVLVSDDGSKDRTAEIVDEEARGWKELRCLRWTHEGKGSTVRRGCLAAAGDFVLIMDADHPTPIDTLDFMLPLMKDHDLVVGVRAFSGEEGSSGRGRRIIGLLQQLFAHLIVFRKSVADSQCGFKLFSQDCVKKIFSRSRVKGGMYDVEIFCISHRLNLRIYSKPVRWVNKEGSTINIVKCMILDPFSLFYIRLNDLMHRYD
ncbi:MAG: glycosyltransferase [Candidatus Omnitrophica bacterium]|nr:glycosyltransferase [Candidatus Omnitrophota bacterium]